MKKYVAFVRAINVGGHAIMKMADLKRMFESFGFENVQTYIQSGNVIFESERSDAAPLEKEIGDHLEKEAGSKLRLFLRTMQEVQSIASNSPFKAKGNETVHVTLLNQKPDKKQREAVMSLKSAADDFEIKGREVYNLRRDREKSVFSNNFIEKTLKLPATTRNLTVIKKIAEKHN